MSNQNWKKVLLINNTITVVFADSTIITASNVTNEIYNKVLELEDKDQIRAILVPELKQVLEEAEITRKANIEKEESINKLVETGKFEFRENQVYLKGINLPIPLLLVDRFVLIKDNPDLLQSHVNFWMWLSLNPNVEAREGVFDFIARYNFKVTSHGFLLAYRRVVSTKSKHEDYIKAVSSAYLKVKTVWKKSPKNYVVIRNTSEEGLDTYTIEKLEDYPNAKDLSEQYLELPDLQQKSFTDNHSKTFDIRIGQKVVMNRKDCDENTKNDCSKGLHYCSNLKDYANFGDTSILVAVNPRDIVSVPENHTSKSRACGYFPVAILDKEDETLLESLEDCQDLLDEFFNEEVELLKEQSNIEARELRKHYIISDIQDSIFKQLVFNISEIKQRLKDNYIVI